MVNYYDNANEVGWYQLALHMVTTLMIAPQAAWIVLNEKIAGKGPDRVWPLQRNILVQNIGLMMLIMACTYVAAPYAVLFIAGESFSPSVDLFRIMLPSVLGMSLSYFIGTQWLGRGLFGQTALLTGLLRHDKSDSEPGLHTEILSVGGRMVHDHRLHCYGIH